MIKRGSKKGYEFSFAWIFAMFVGAAFIGLAIYSATQLIQMKQGEIDSQRAKQIGVILTPVETGLEEGKFATLAVRDETEIIGSCRPPSATNPFGSQLISVSSDFGFGKGIDSSGVNSTFHNRYIFSSKPLRGDEEFYALSKPFNFPFKIADMIIMWSDQQSFCFLSAPAEVRSEITALNMTNVFLTLQSSNCPQQSTHVCFSSGADCDVIVNDQNNQGKVSKGAINLDYIKPSGPDKYGMMYAAIFSDPDIYNCQLRRISARASELSAAYLEEARLLSVSPSPCASGLILPLDLYNSKFLAFSAGDLTDLNELSQAAENARSVNEVISCNLW